MSTARTLAFELHERWLLLIHTAAAPSPGEWAPYMEAAKKMDAALDAHLETAGILVFTDGGAPNVSQRNEINAWLQGRHIHTSVICHSAFVRGVVTALNWFNYHIRAFAPEAWRQAMDHAQIPDAARDDVARRLVALSQQLPPCQTIERAFGKHHAA
jgi:hypothetical protein